MELLQGVNCDDSGRTSWPSRTWEGNGREMRRMMDLYDLYEELLVHCEREMSRMDESKG
jgi:hypothetical protein